MGVCTKQGYLIGGMIYFNHFLVVVFACCLLFIFDSNLIISRPSTNVSLLS